MTTSIATASLADYALGWAGRSSQLHVRSRLVETLLDHIACVCEGADTPQAKYPNWIRDCRTSGVYATAVGGARLPAGLAAYCNGQAANAIDYDDTLVGHPGAAIIAAALAAGESTHASLDLLVAGICAGYDVHYALTAAGWPSRARSALVRGIGTWESVAAAVAVAIVWQLSEAEVRAAIDLAAVHCVPPYVAKWYERPVPSVKNNLGWAALTGMWSVEQVLEGARGVSNALDGPQGFFRIAGSDRWRWPPEVDLSTPAVIRVAFKRFPACWHIQEYLRAVHELVLETGSADCAGMSVICTVPQGVAKFLDRHPLSPADVAFSLPCTAAMVLMNEPRGAGWSEPGIYESESVMGVISRSSFTPGRSRRVQVQLGASRTREIHVPVADYWSPSAWGLGRCEVIEKFRALVTRHVPLDVASKALAFLTSGSGRDGLAPVVDVLRGRHLKEGQSSGA